MNIFEKIETFVVLADCNSFTEAARRLYCSQSTISHHINKLEQNFDAKLFNRSRVKVELTKQGEVLLHYAKKMMKLVDEASDKIKKVDDAEQTMSIYISQYIAENYFTKVFSQPDHHLSPQPKYEINSYCYADLKKLLQEEQTNFAIMPIYPEDQYMINQYNISVLFEEELLLVFPATHPWAERKVIYTRDLQDETILLPNSHYFQQYIVNQLQNRQVDVRYLQMSNFEIIKKAVQTGYGFAFLPYGVIEEELKKKELVAKQVLGIHLQRKNGIVFRKDIKLTQKEQAFCEKIKDHFQLLQSPQS